jgi:hypothetical protein
MPIRIQLHRSALHPQPTTSQLLQKHLNIAEMTAKMLISKVFFYLTVLQLRLHKYYGSTENCPVVDSRMSGRQFKSMTGQAGLTPGQGELKLQVFFILDMVSC